MASPTTIPPTSSASGDGAERSLRERYDEVKSRIAAAAKRSGRSPSEIMLVAVTKNASIDQIRELISFGQVDLAENQVQQLQQRAAQVDEFLARRREMSSSAAKLPAQVRWHMIGSLQRNKIKKAIDLVRLVHSVDNLRLAEDLQIAAQRRATPIEVLVEVNVAGEKSKHGITPAAAKPLVEMIDTMLSLKPRGLMCMAPHSDDKTVLRGVFERTAELFQDIRRSSIGGDRFDILSMGMSNDFETAIECGANLVRIGTALFGPPQHGDADEVDDHDEDGASEHVDGPST
ncbi:MAG: YggS family pyridoxal phosphate-dependent enzyme [Phycisphaerae bacterium]|nr:YggS family pyridoxal phosphate-dependent enzyme [Phycisphaerae bacterium]